MEDQETCARGKIKIWLEKNYLVVRQVTCLVVAIFVFCLIFADKWISNNFTIAFGTLLLGAASILGIIFGPQKIQDAQVEIQKKKQESELEIQESRGRFESDIDKRRQEFELEIEQKRHNAELEIERKRHNAALEIQQGKQDSKLDFEREKHARDYKFSVAKRVTVLFGGVRPVFWEIRNPFVGSNEIKKGREYYLTKIKEIGGRESKREISEEDMLNKEIFLVIGWRMHEAEKFFKRINALQPEFLAAFKTQKPFTDLWEIIGNIQTSSKAMGSYDSESAGSKQFKIHEEIVFLSDEEFFSDLDDQGEPTAGVGPTTLRINKIVREVVKICSPVLKVSDDE